MIEKKLESNDETLNKFIISITNKYQINTVKNYRSLLTTFLKTVGKSFVKATREDIDAFLDGVRDVGRPEGRVGCLDHDVARAQAVDGFAIGVETEKTPAQRDIDLLAELLAEGFVRSCLFVLEDVGHGHELGRTGPRR